MLLNRPSSMLIAMAAASVLLLAGCAGKRYTPGPTTGFCFATHRMQAWYPVSRHVVRVNAGHAFFEVEISGPCPSPENRDKIFFVSKNGKICGRSWESIRVGESGWQSCSIESVRPISREVFYGRPRP